MKHPTIIALFAATAISASSFAFAEQSANVNRPIAPANEAAQATQAANTTPQVQDSTDVTTPAPTATPNITSDVNSAVTPATDTQHTPVYPVSEMPKADKSFVAKLNEFYNAKNIDGIVDMYSKDFIVANAHGTIKNAEDLRKMLIDMLANPNYSTGSLATVDYMRDIAPGVAVFGIDTTAPASDPATGEMKSYVTMTVKYENNDWKIVSEQVSHKMSIMHAKPEHKEEKQSSGLMTAIAAILGVLVGYLGGKFFGRKDETTITTTTK
ncbi:MAG: nuclear transport factor 2 family protein [Alphaproteobacteria bacterium]|nr:nuclear transport factor 2 family protein [Candidatus Jidaibacter sp.]